MNNYVVITTWKQGFIDELKKDGYEASASRIKGGWFALSTEAGQQELMSICERRHWAHGEPETVTGDSLPDSEYFCKSCAFAVLAD
jgi:hypothetical protein